MGDPLCMLAEENSEVIKEIMKAKRFGLLGCLEWTSKGNPPPIENIHRELGDVFAVIDILVDLGVLDFEKIMGYRVAKKQKIEQDFDR